MTPYTLHSPAGAPGSRPAIGIIVPAYGVADLVGDALRSLQAQTVVDWEAIVVDDGDASVAAAMLPFTDDARIRLVETANAGPSVARNRAAAAATAPVLSFLDGDDVYAPDYLASMLAAIAADPGCGFVTCDAEYFGLPDRAGQRFSHFNPQRAPVELAAVLDRRTNVFIGSTVRRAAFDAVGGFDPAMRHAEDFDLWVRLLTAGWSAAIVPRPLVRYRRRARSASTEETLMLAGAERVYDKAIAALDGRPEAATARGMRDAVHRQQRIAQGEALLKTGRVREGIAILKATGPLSARWRIAIPVMEHAPILATLLLRLRPLLSPAKN